MKKYFESACDSESVPPDGPDLLDEALLTLFELNWSSILSDNNFLKNINFYHFEFQKK